jgi:hypothetical protein
VNPCFAPFLQLTACAPIVQVTPRELQVRPAPSFLIDAPEGYESWLINTSWGFPAAASVTAGSPSAGEECGGRGTPGPWQRTLVLLSAGFSTPQITFSAESSHTGVWEAGVPEAADEPDAIANTPIAPAMATENTWCLTAHILSAAGSAVKQS